MVVSMSALPVSRIGVASLMVVDRMKVTMPAND